MPTVVFDAEFRGSNTDGFVYSSNVFGSTRNVDPTYAKGYRETKTGHQLVTVELGGRDDADIYNISGGWKRSFSLSKDGNITIEVTFELEQNSEYENDEYSQALCSVDGTLRGANSTVKYLDQFTGDGEYNGGNKISGFVTRNLQVNNLAAGSHSIIVGGFNNKKTELEEVTWIRFDSVKVVAVA
jgi:hypothetical protein